MDRKALIFTYEPDEYLGEKYPCLHDAMRDIGLIILGKELGLNGFDFDNWNVEFIYDDQTHMCYLRTYQVDYYDHDDEIQPQFSEYFKFRLLIDVTKNVNDRTEVVITWSGNYVKINDECIMRSFSDYTHPITKKRRKEFKGELEKKSFKKSPNEFAHEFLNSISDILEDDD